MKGIERFRQAIKNQQDAGEGEFHLAYKDAEEITDEIENELSRLSWAQGVPAPVDANCETVPLTIEVMYDREGFIFKVILYALDWSFGFDLANHGVFYHATEVNDD